MRHFPKSPLRRPAGPRTAAGDSRTGADAWLPGLLLAAVAGGGLVLSAILLARLLLPALSSPHGLVPDLRAPGGTVGAQEDAPGGDLPRVTVEVPPASSTSPPTVGDRVALRLAVTTEAHGFEPRFPAWGETWGEAEIVEVTEPSRATAEDSPTTTWQQTVTVAVFRPGRIPLPPREVVVPTAGGPGLQLSTPTDLALEVLSVLPPPAEGEDADAIPEPLAEKGLVELPLGGAFWWTAGLMALALAALALILWRRHREAEQAGPRRRLAPIEELQRALSNARALPAPEEGLAGVSLALRRYLGRRLGFPAAEGTTTEVRRQLAARHIPGGVPERCGRLLAACDLVKFARHPARREDVERQATAAQELADAVEQHLRPAEEAAADPDRVARRGRKEAA